MAGRRPTPARRAAKPAAGGNPLWRSRIVRHGAEAPGKLKANPANWRRHPPGQARALAGMLAEVGWVQSVVVNTRTGNMVDGHLRVELALERREPTVPVTYVDLSPEEEAIVLAALDPLTGLATTDPAAFASLMEKVSVGDAALRSMLEQMQAAAAPKARPGKTDPDEAPPAPAKPYVERGDLYELGAHRVLCGDATAAADVARLLGGAKAAMAFTDPPYNMAYRSKAHGSIENDDLDEASFVRLMLASTQQLTSSLQDGGSYYVCMSGLAYPLVAHQLRKLGLESRPIVWVKPSAGLGAQDYRPQFEVLLYGFAGSRKKRVWHGERKASDVWEFDSERGLVARPGPGDGMTLEFGGGVETVQVELEKRCGGRVIHFDGRVSDVWRFGREAASKYVHPNQKPVDLVERAIGNSSNPGTAVLDLFGGSGTTLIAAERTGRRALLLELDPKFAQVIIERWQAYTGARARKVNA